MHNKNKSHRWIPYAFVLPAFILHFLVVMAPSLSTFVMSLYDWNGIGGGEFIGLANFKEILTQDSVVKLALLHNIIWMCIFITVPMILGFIVALLVSRIHRGQMTLRTIYFIPYVISAVVAGRIWTAFMSPFYGFNIIFQKLGLTGLSSVKWLGDPKIALYSVAFVDNWHFWGFVMVLFLGALQQVDPSLYDAAKVDGANGFQEILYVSIPGIRQTIAFVFITVIMWSFTTFDYVYVMTNGGPANSTEILSTWIYKNAFVKYRAGYADAICVLQSALCVVLYFIQKWVSKKGGLEDD